MGITKTDGFTVDITEMAAVLKALGHPARLSIMLYLAKSPACICGDIVNELPLAQSTVSKHLSELKKVSLIQGSISGNNICYCINTETWKKVEKFFTEVAVSCTSTNSCC